MIFHREHEENCGILEDDPISYVKPWKVPILIVGLFLKRIRFL